MAIKEYIVNNEKKFEVYVNLRSKSDPTVRFQKRIRGVTSLKAAKSEEKKQTRLVLERIHKSEGIGLDWETILDRWELFHKSVESNEYKNSVIADYVCVLRKWTKPWFAIPVASLSRADGRDLFNAMNADGRANSYQKKVKRIISRVFDWAIDNRFVPVNLISPLKEIKLKRGEEKLPEILTLDEIKLLLSSAKRLDHPWFPIWALAVLTGMRSGELYALTWESIDLDGNLIFVHKNYVTKDREIGPTKGRYWRTVPISSDLKSFLLGLKLSSGGGYSHPEFKGEFVLPRFKAWNSGHQAGELRTFCEMSKMKSIGFHTLRACFATHLLNLNIPTAKVMKICGWKELKTMEKYIRLAGVEVKGITEDFKVMPKDDVLMGSVSNLIDFKKSKR